MKNTNFEVDEKIQFFDKIAELYFNKNFGTMSKSDLETLIFSEYIEHCLKLHLPFDDYTLSKQLGITQSRIRSLKERKELKYPHEGFDWREDFISSLKNAKYDSEEHYVKFIVEDINVMNEIRHYIEVNGWYDECSLNKKLLRLPLDCFTEICVEDKSLTELFTPEVKNKIKAVAKDDKNIANFLSDFSKDGLKSFLMSASKETLLGVIHVLPFGGITKAIFETLENVISGMC